MRARYHKKTLHFKKPSGTSRGVLHEKESYFIILENGAGQKGVGECSVLKGLSLDDRPDYLDQLNHIIVEINVERPISEILESLDLWPSIKFGLESALIDLENDGVQILFPSQFTSGNAGIPINGLIWMGDKNDMLSQAQNLLERGFTCLKMKIGAINFEDELEIIAHIRNTFSEEDLILRVDANGAFLPDQAIEKLKRLSEFGLHSIEQPVKAGQIELMAELCEHTPLAIALDEELIGSSTFILDQINPQYIILKPSLLGGLKSSMKWIRDAEQKGIGWWVTSALESNIGLNAISQWTYTLQPIGHQGLGTGSLYTDNIASPLEIRNEEIHYNTSKNWELNEFF
ncbi:o-succinylbenzoate synthase [Portibacter marinus]|uniref:o-succinylbenzoate synthase n=1 Tax=Portibacter marinus TaxID=2898660 RepID=UPI001F458074|nr:o-succinylbenzoate synthase [Portibacter marinus]